MSNVALFTNGSMLQVPEHLRNLEVDEQTRALMGGSGGLRISIKGGVWRLLNNGEEIMRNEDRALNVVVVRASPDNGRQFYADAYVEGEAAKPPTCYSTNGLVPEADSPVRQSATCATCPQNVQGSGNNGSRACRYFRNLAVVLDNDLGGGVYAIQLPATSNFGKPENNVMPLQAYAKLLAQHKLNVNVVVTEMRFDTTVSTPKLGFKAVRYLNPDEIEIVKQQAETPEAIAATKTTSYQQDSGDPAALDIAGTRPDAATVAQTHAAQQAATVQTAQQSPAVVAEPAVTLAQAPVTPQKRTRSKPAAAAGAPTTAAEPAASATPASTATATSAPPPAQPPAAPIKKLTPAAGSFTLEQYYEQGWDDAGLMAEGLMVVEHPAPPPAPPKPAAPAKPKAPPKPGASAPVQQAAQTAAAAVEHVEAEPMVVSPPMPVAGEAVIADAAAMLGSWDSADDNQ